MSDLTLALTIAGMAAVTFGPRLVPTLFLAAAALPRPVVVWLRQVPPAVIAALLAPSLFAPAGTLDLGPGNYALWLAVPTLLLAWRTRNFYLTIAFGIGSLALLRLITG
ncbi:AzlD domain-containing protein [Streptomyces sp. NPDC048550]|uniref:AzlD domain-containing protein n=1 Tax=unclassified Streptomyces TaxID=2593676 RepID=UPI00224F25AD|nr:MULTISPECIES: AzlD domain-containing protein [unclassified Streptomyces]WSW45085.1 AzlD domain-containing protein [Streptomyces sp. NBC_01001]WSW60487.1 AzlD domain-containing protein [Streptomyces sp. NBC_00998]MCX4629040.1 AzlD domain-containing protein [Streptomyces sp. NBC_01443]MCX5146909.1 AzlD domain-containing protein [Streptomyces sp. NBC_00320]WSN50088.1 AzlD domain-containing protein [Streptomyces sp. NBC_01296]